MKYGRKALRDIRAMGWRALLLVLVIGVGPGAAAGIGLALHDVRASRDAFYRDNGLADIDVRLAQPVPANTLVSRAADAEATRAQARLILGGTADLPSGQHPPAEVVGMDPATTLNRLVVLSGQGLSTTDPSGAAVEADFARLAGLHPGDMVSLNLAGRPLLVHVRGLVRSPEYLLATADPQYLIPQPGSLAVLFLPLAGLQQQVGLAGQVNDLIADLPAGAAPGAVSRLGQGLPVAHRITRADQFSYRFTTADIRAFSLFTPVLGGVFATVGFLLLALSLYRMVYSQRRELGALLALGYRRRAVVATILIPAGLLGLGGAIAAAASAVAVARLVADEYATAVGFPTVSHTYAVTYLLQAAGFALVATAVAAGLPASALARLRPIDAMRGEALPTFHLPRWWRRITTSGGPTVSYAVRSLLRRPLRTASTAISLAAAIGLGAALAILATSTNHAVDAAFSHQDWTYSIDLATPLGVIDATRLATAAGAPAQPVVTGSARLASAGRGTDTELVGLTSRPALQHLTIVAGTSPGHQRIVISEQVANALGVHIGDPVHVTTSTGRADLTVAGIARTLAGQRVFLPFTDAATLLGLPGLATGLYTAATPAAATRLAADPRVARVTAKAAAVTGMRTLTNELTGLIDTLLAISLGVGALFLVSSLALSHLDRASEFAVLRALGYRRRHLATIITTETLIQTISAAALSIPTAVLIAWVLDRRIGQAWFTVPLTPTPSDFTLAIVPALALVLLAAAYATRRAIHIDIATTIRTRQIG